MGNHEFPSNPQTMQQRTLDLIRKAPFGRTDCVESFKIARELGLMILTGSHCGTAGKNL